MQELGILTKTIVQERTRKGFGITEDEDKQERFTKLNKKYVKQRRNISLSRFATPGKSNLHRTGNMVSNLTVKSKTNETVISPGNNENAKKLQYQLTGKSPYRKFLGLTNKDKSVTITRFLLDKLKRYLDSRRL